MKRNFPTFSLLLSVLLFSPAPGSFLQGQDAGETLLHHTYDNLARAMGRDRNTLPLPQIRDKKLFMASYSRSANTIYVDRLALETCLGMGEAAGSALAFLIGHELTHFLQGAEWSAFVTSIVGGEGKYQQEKNADINGAFFAYLARYRTTDVIPEFLERVYKVYGLNDRSFEDYPPLEERKKMAAEACRQVTDLHHILRAGHYLTVTGQFEAAMACYEYVLRFVRYPEIYNNLGAAQLLAAVRAGGPSDDPFLYPFVFDTREILRTPGEYSREELLAKAIENLSAATEHNRGYHPPFLNLACAYAMNKQPEPARRRLEALAAVDHSAVTGAGIDMLRGILAAQSGDREAAGRFFRKVQQQGPTAALRQIAAANLQRLATNTPTAAPDKGGQPEDRLEGVNLLYYRLSPSQPATILRANGSFLREQFKWTDLGQSTILSYDITGEPPLLFQLTEDRRAATKAGVRIGDQAPALDRAYAGQPIIWYPLLNGSIALVPAKNLVFQLDPSGAITEWGIFAP